MRSSASNANVMVCSATTAHATEMLEWKDFLIDCTKFRDPIGQPALRLLAGTDKRVIEFVKQDPKVAAVINTLHAEIALMIKNGCSWGSVCFHDRRGTHIAPALAELFAEDMDQAEYKVCLNHYKP